MKIGGFKGFASGKYMSMFSILSLMSALAVSPLASYEILPSTLDLCCALLFTQEHQAVGEQA